MGIKETFKTFGKNLVGGTKKVIKGVANVVLKTVEVSAAAVAALAQVTANLCKKLSTKIETWTTPNEPEETNYPPGNVQRIYQPIIGQGVDAIRKTFPEGVTKEANSGDPYERVKKMEDLCRQYANVLNVDPLPEFEVVAPENPEDTWELYGSYNFGEHKIMLNLPMIVSGEPNLLKEQIGTAFHELVHARQYLAVNAWLNNKSVEKYGYSEDYVQILAENFKNYIRPEENYEAYTKQPIEAEARWCKEQLLKNINL